MASDLPYFRFTCQEWDSGDISLENDSTQGAFMGICSYYWSQNCSVLIEKLFKKFPKRSKKISLLIEKKIIKVENDFVRINFLDRQLAILRKEREKRAKAGAKGGKAKSSNAKAMLKRDPSYKDKDKDKDNNNTYAGAKKPPARKPDPYWDIIVDVFGWNPQTDAEKSRVGKIRKDLIKKTPDPEELRARVIRYKYKNPDWALTPEAVLKHWDDLKPRSESRQAGGNRPNIPPPLTPEQRLTDDDKRALKLKLKKMGLVN